MTYHIEDIPDEITLSFAPGYKEMLALGMTCKRYYNLFIKDKNILSIRKQLHEEIARMEYIAWEAHKNQYIIKYNLGLQERVKKVEERFRNRGGKQNELVVTGSPFHKILTRKGYKTLCSFEFISIFSCHKGKRDTTPSGLYALLKANKPVICRNPRIGNWKNKIYDIEGNAIFTEKSVRCLIEQHIAADFLWIINCDGSKDIQYLKQFIKLEDILNGSNIGATAPEQITYLVVFKKVKLSLVLNPKSGLTYSNIKGCIEQSVYSNNIRMERGYKKDVENRFDYMNEDVTTF